VSQRFGMSAPKAENGFMPQENCFVAGAATKQLGMKCPQFE
jgi:hypothetical protein